MNQSVSEGPEGSAIASSPGGFPREWSFVERVFSVLVFPVVLTTAVWVGYAWMESGVPAEVAVFPVIAGTYFLLAILERIFPHHEDWLRSRGDLSVDLGYLFTNGSMVRLTEPLMLSGVVYLAMLVSEDFGTGYWPTAWPILGQLVLALVLAEFVEYWCHRGMHEIDWMWRFHATHHSAPRLYFLNAVRFHPVDIFLIGTGKLLPIAVLGASPKVLGLVTLFAAVHGAFQHSNLKLKLGPLNWIFSMAELHRWHHSPVVEEANHNYGGNLIIWDVVFGTRWLPKDRKSPAEIGMDSLPHFPMGFFSQMVSPLRWEKVVEESTARKTS